MSARRGGGLALIGLCAAVSIAPPAAVGATATVTGDDGNSLPITPGLVIRNMDPSVGYALAAGERFITATVTGPDGAPVQTRSCTSFTSSSAIGYRGNGLYAVTVQAFPADDVNCSTPVGPPVTTQFTINATVALAAPAGRLLVRGPNSLAIRAIPVAIDLNPGALTTEVRYARGGAIGPAGAITGPSEQGFADASTGTVTLRLREPGRYVIVARQKGRGGSGERFTPWSPAAVIAAVAPFDLRRVAFPDARGPRYTLRGEIREPTARGSVAVSLARGAGGRFRPLGRAKIRANGSFVKHFTERRFGTYRLRYLFTGSATTAGGVIIQRISITRRVFFG